MHLTMLNADKNVVYAKDEKECVDFIDRLHFADRLSSNVRIPNFIFPDGSRQSAVLWCGILTSPLHANVIEK